MKDAEVFVVGGANSAGQAAVHLARYAPSGYQTTSSATGGSWSPGPTSWQVDDLWRAGRSSVLPCFWSRACPGSSRSATSATARFPDSRFVPRCWGVRAGLPLPPRLRAGAAAADQVGCAHPWRGLRSPAARLHPPEAVRRHRQPVVRVGAAGHRATVRGVPGLDRRRCAAPPSTTSTD